MKILIFGSEGFIGSNLKNYFSKKYQTYCADVLDLNYPNYLKIEDLSKIQDIFYKYSFDLCINAAGIGSIAPSFTNPVNDFSLHSYLTLNILENIRCYNPTCKYINISSAAVYGEPLYLPIDENHPVNPISPYGFNKYISELITTEYHNIFKIQTINIRIFSTYGPGLKKQLFWDLYQKYISNETIILHGSGDETRDYIYIDDLINFVQFTIDKIPFNNETFNLGSGRKITIKEIAELFVSLLPAKKEIRFSGIKMNGSSNLCEANINKIHKLGFIPLVSIEDGISKYIKWLKTINS